MSEMFGAAADVFAASPSAGIGEKLNDAAEG
jgi:hypothetical protein